MVLVGKLFKIGRPADEYTRRDGDHGAEQVHASGDAGRAIHVWMWVVRKG